ncbi:MAG: TolC family outer membrane protein [Desulfocapsaceae bacterium]|nr:TolC family outer membrane protein [Desulfocapsaceae bacterium]
MKISKILSTTLIGGALLFDGSCLQAETLQDAIGTMLQTNPEIRSMAHNRLGRDEEVRQAKSGYLPEINFSAGVGVQDIQEPTNDNLTPQQYTLSLRQNVFTGLATNNEVGRQKARVQSQAYSLQGASENTALRTAEVYLNVLRQQELHRLSQENLDSHVRIADQINLRTESGVASKSDSDQVAARLSLAQANVVATNTNLVDAHTNYLAVVGHLPTDLQEPTPPDSLMPASLQDAEAEAIKMHPTLKSAGADLEARQKQSEVAKAPYWPIIDLEVDQNWEEDYDTVGKKESLIAMARLRYNLFRGFKDEARRAETVELVSEAREIRNNTHRQVVESMRLSWMAYQAVKDQIKYLEQRVDFSIGTIDAYTKQFNLGKRTLLDVLDSDAEVIDAKRALVAARYDGLYAQYRILNGLGQLVKSFDKEWPKESQVTIGSLVESEKQ